MSPNLFKNKFTYKLFTYKSYFFVGCCLCMATYHPSRKLSKLDEPDIWDTAGKVGMNS